MNLSLDGFIEDPSDAIDWILIDEELRQHFNDLGRTIGIHLYGRRMYKILQGYWTTADEDPANLDTQLNLRLLETRTFNSGVVLVRYQSV